MSASLECPAISAFFASMGAMSAVALGCMGAAYGTAKSSIGISAVGVLQPALIMRAVLPVVMAGIVGIYGLIVSIIISTSRKLGFPFRGGKTRRVLCLFFFDLACLAFLLQSNHFVSHSWW